MSEHVRRATRGGAQGTLRTPDWRAWLARRRPRAAARWSAVGLTAALLAGACTSSGDGVPDGGPKVSDKPLWDQRTLGLEEAVGVEFAADLAVVNGDVGSGVHRMLVVDAANGAPHWLLTEGEPLRGGNGAEAYEAFDGAPTVIGDRDGDWSVLVPYRVGGEGKRTTETGLAALSGEDGRVRWMTPLAKADSDDGADQGGDSGLDLRTLLTATDGRHALLTTLPRQSHQPDQVRTYAVDLTNGRTLWQTAGRWGYQIAGRTVVTMEANDTGEVPWEEGDVDEVTGLDVATGERRWQLSERYAEPTPLAAAGKVFVLSARKGELARAAIMVDSATGKEIGELEKTFLSCTPDGQRLIACVGSSDPEVTVIDATTGKAETQAKKIMDGAEHGVLLDGIREGGIFVSDHKSEGGVDSIMMNRAGEQITEKLPGAMLGYSGRYAAFSVPRKDAKGAPNDLAVYRVGKGDTPKGPPAAPKPSVKPLAYDADPLWAGTTSAHPDLQPGDLDLGLTSITGVRIVGDTLVHTGQVPENDHANTLRVADVDSGEQRWTVTEGDPLGGGDTAHPNGVIHPIGAPGREQLLIRYVNESADRAGVVALNLKDGKVAWKEPAPLDDPDTEYALLSHTDAGHFLMEVTSYQPDTVRTVALDAATRRELWQAPDFEPSTFAGELVLGERDGTVVALDASTGKERWSLADRHPQAEVQVGSETGKAVVVSLPEGTAVVDVATGRQLARTDLPLTNCSGSATPLLACQVGSEPPFQGSFAVTIEVAEDTARVTPLLVTTPLGTYRTLDNRLFATRQDAGEAGASDPADQLRYVELDARGTVLADDLPGRPMDLTDDYAVFATGSVSLDTAKPLRFEVRKRG